MFSYALRTPPLPFAVLFQHLTILNRIPHEKSAGVYVCVLFNDAANLVSLYNVARVV